MKHCGRCDTEKDESGFNKDKNTKDGLSCWCRECRGKYRRAKYIDNPEKFIKKTKSWREANPEKVRNTNRLWHEANPDKVRELNRDWRRDNPEKMKGYQNKWIAKNPEREQERHRIWRRANPNIVNASTARRRARKHKAFGTEYTTHEMIGERVEYYGWCCWICGAPFEAIDHVKPITKNGAHLPCNLRPICNHCNSVKNDKWPFNIEELRGGGMCCLE